MATCAGRVLCCYKLVGTVMFTGFLVYSFASLVAATALPLKMTTGTPRGIRDIFIGRCHEYQQVLRPDLFKDGTRNCTDMWQRFFDAFANKDPCSVLPEDYAKYVAAADHHIETKDKVMYWTGQVYPLVIDFSANGKRYATIRDLLAAYVIKNIDNWCGQTDAPGINYVSCPTWGECPHLAATSYWKALSKSFAYKVQGTIHVMVNGSNNNAYSNASIFAQSELKNLESQRTPVLHVHLAYSLHGPPRERCVDGSLLQLKKDVEKKGMKFKCSDDELNLLFFQCADDISSSRCPTAFTGRSLIPNASTQPNKAHFFWTTLFLVTVSLAF